MKKRKDEPSMKSRLFAVDMEFMVKRFAIDHKYELEREEIELNYKKSERRIYIGGVICLLVITVLGCLKIYLHQH